ncbi:tyrosine-type recombinase/integrase [Rhodococcus pyridinivorans]|uniref:tyrosine-type recombinase/integrase n=1 Tax=Rhodococcus pyridinivorans TaxID=103816 RepID=UPI0039B6236D
MVVQRVLQPIGGDESWTVLDDDFAVIEPIEMFLAYLTVIERSPATVRSYAFDLRDYFQFLNAHQIDWTAVDLADLGRFVGWLRLTPAARMGAVTGLPTAAHCSATTINRKLAAVGSFYRFHARHGVSCTDLLTTIEPGGGRAGSWRPFLAHLGGHETRKTIKLTPPRRLPRTLTGEQITTILGCCDRLRDRFLIALLAGTGMRVGEALGLRHEDLDPAGRLVRVRARCNSNRARVKSGQREVPVAPALIRLYTDYLVTEYGDLDCDYVFVNLWAGPLGQPWRYWNVTDLIARLRRRSGIEFTAHMFRHTYATELLRREVPAEIVQKLLGHASITTTIGIYAHLDITHVRDVLERSGWLPRVTDALTSSESEPR